MIDVLIVNGTIVSMDSNRTILWPGTVAIKDGKIVAVETRGSSKSELRAKETIDATGKLVMPGLINTHTHAAMTIFRGYAEDLPLMEWLQNYIWPAEAKYINADTVRLGTQLAAVEMINSGTTTFNDMYFFEDEVAIAAKEVGIRAVIGEGLLDFPTPDKKTPQEGLDYTEMLIKKWRNDPLITVAESLGFLGDNVIAAHSVHLIPNDIQLITKRKVGVSHNPESNMKLASGIAPIPELLDAGAKIGLGTDGAASNNDLNMFEEMDTAAILHKFFAKNSSVVNAKSVVEMATIDGAKVLGLDKEIGSIEKGKRADIIIIDLHKPHLTPLYNPYSQIVYAMDGADAETVIIEGRIVMRDHKILTVNEDKIIQDMNALAAKIREESNNHKNVQ